jgi:CRP-like cAMP-binding protein
MLHLLPAHALLHLGNILFLLAYSVRDILWLRLLTVVATLCLLPYYCVQQTPLYAPIFWCSLFTLVNIIQIGLLILERRPVFLGDEELHLYRTIFHGLRPREFARLLSLAEWRRAPAGEKLLHQGQPAPELVLLSTGAATVVIDDVPIAELTGGQFVGEMGFLTNSEASATVIARHTTDYLAWPTEQLRTLLTNCPALHQKLLGVLGNDLTKKLRQETQPAQTPSRPPTAMTKSVQFRLRKKTNPNPIATPAE